MSAPHHLSIDEARRIALTAQRLSGPGPDDLVGLVACRRQVDQQIDALADWLGLRRVSQG
ncbi:MAG: hypothetical protein EOO74_08115 [Myxococcales bacterium]|nr:MAG: hypothetical protein EOO74_08115 [Myxococcales bacterium]